MVLGKKLFFRGLTERVLICSFRVILAHHQYHVTPLLRGKFEWGHLGCFQERTSLIGWF
jgi:hypothetical protein